MTSGIYLGDTGTVEIKRTSLNAPLSSDLDAADVNVSLKRFSFNFDSGALITGDRVHIYTEDKSTLQLVAGHNYPDWAGYISINEAGGIRLFDTFSEAINGELSDALTLTAPTSTQQILVATSNEDYRFVSKIQNYQFTTNREAVDLTSLGDEFKRNYASGLISGQGSLDCFWEYERRLCTNDCTSQYEISQYFAELVIRMQQGSSFAGRFNLYTDVSESVWWDVPVCIVTNVSMAFEPGVPIRTRIDFVTSGEIRMKIGRLPGFLVQEDTDPLLQEDLGRIELEDD